VDYSIIIAALITGTLTVAGTITAARFSRRVAVNAGAAVQTAEQVAAERLITDARDEAEQVKTEAKVTADAVIAKALEKAEKTEAERQAWHEHQILSITAERDELRTEVAMLRGQLKGTT
jgi:hypothetical protein